MPRLNIALIRWQGAALSERIGRIPLLLSLLPCGLLALWLALMAPHTAALREELAALGQQLRTTLPFDQRQPDLHAHLSMSEYQQVSLIFDELQKHGLSVKASRWQLDKQGDAPSLLLDIPLQGEYLPLTDALESISRALPLEIAALSLQRASPTVNVLDVALRIRLRKETP